MEIRDIEQLRDLRKEILEIESRITKKRERLKTIVADTVTGSKNDATFAPTTITIRGVDRKLEGQISTNIAYLERRRLQLEEKEERITKWLYEGDLSSKERRVLTLYYVEDHNGRNLTWQQVARRLGEWDEQTPRKIRDKVFERMRSQSA